MIDIRGFSFNYKNSLVRKNSIKSISRGLAPEIKIIKERLRHAYSYNYSFLNLPFDKEQTSEIKKLARHYKKLDFVVVIGMGGSILGTKAIYDALKAGISASYPRMLFLEDINAQKLEEAVSLISKKRYIINVVSKSGNTTETISNFLVLLKQLRINKKDMHKRVVFTCDYNTRLYRLGVDLGVGLLGLQTNVVGRFSVFSSVSLFSLYLCGVNIDLLLLGARSAVYDMLKPDSASAVCASILYFHLKSKNIHDMFLFSSELESLGKWYRQLLSESTGKKSSKCYTPTVSIGSQDLHSISQLYFGGPQDKFTTFVYIKNKESDFVVPSYFDFIVPGINNKKISKINDFIYGGVKKAYIKKKRPFVEFVLYKKSEEVLGEFMMQKLIETLFLGHLMGVNVFDQPAVELYKKETRKLLLKR